MSGRYGDTLRNQAENLSEGIRRGDREHGENMGNTADDTFMRGRDDDMAGSQQQRRGLGGEEYGLSSSGEYGSQARRDDELGATQQRMGGDTYGSSTGRDTYGGGVGGGDTYDPSQRGTYDSERRKQPGVGDEYGTGTTGGDSYGSQQQQEGGAAGGGLGAVSGMESGRHDDQAYGSSYAGSGQGQQQQQGGHHQKRKDSTFGKLMEKAGGVLGNKNLEEKGHQRRESAAGREAAKETTGR